MTEPDPEKRPLAYYAAAVSLIVHADSTSQRQTSGYLVVGTLLLAGWPSAAPYRGAQTLIAVVGIVLSVTFLALQFRTRAHLDSYLATAKDIEGENKGPVRRADLGGLPLGRLVSYGIPLLGVIVFSALLCKAPA